MDYKHQHLTVCYQHGEHVIARILAVDEWFSEIYIMSPYAYNKLINIHMGHLWIHIDTNKEN